MTRKVAIVALVLLVVVVGAWPFVALDNARPTTPGNYERCKERMRSDFRNSRTVDERPRECQGLGNDDLQRIIGEILAEEVYDG